MRRAVGHHLPEQNKEEWVITRSAKQQSGQAKPFYGAAHASIPRTHALLTTGGVPAALCERAKRFFLHPNALQLNGSACGPGAPLCWLHQEVVFIKAFYWCYNTFIARPNIVPIL